MAQGGNWHGLMEAFLSHLAWAAEIDHRPFSNLDVPEFVTLHVSVAKLVKDLSHT
jgi:hypothetical protein